MSDKRRLVGERRHNSGNPNPETKHLQAYKWKKGQSGNPAGRGKHTKTHLAEDFIADCYDAWKIYGKAALETTAMTDPSTFVRVIAGLMPRDVDITITAIRAERMSDDELLSYLEAPDRSDRDEASEDAQALQPVG